MNRKKLIIKAYCDAALKDAVRDISYGRRVSTINVDTNKYMDYVKKYLEDCGVVVVKAQYHLTTGYFSLILPNRIDDKNIEIANIKLDKNTTPEIVRSLRCYFWLLSMLSITTASIFIFWVSGVFNG